MFFSPLIEKQDTVCNHLISLKQNYLIAKINWDILSESAWKDIDITCMHINRIILSSDSLLQHSVGGSSGRYRVTVFNEQFNNKWTCIDLSGSV